MSTESLNKVNVFTRRLDFYWQFIAVYAITMIVYALIKGSIDEWKFTVVILDPVVILLAIFILATFIGLIESKYIRHELIIGQDFITIKNRFRERKFSSKEILKITLGRENLRYKGIHKVIKLRVSTRRRPFRIRTQSYLNEKALIQSIVHLKKSFNR